jgi:hypothetical protein
VLPLGFTETERQYFDQYIQSLKQLNPEWVVAPDRCQPGEADAYVMLHSDENWVLFAVLDGMKTDQDIRRDFQKQEFELKNKETEQGHTIAKMRETRLDHESR